MSDLTRREQEKENKRNIILQAATKIFGDKGFDGASMDEIAKEAQFTKRTIYKYFPNKVDLFFAIALKSFKGSLKFIGRVDRSNVTVFQQLLEGCKLQYRNALKNPRIFRISSEVGYVRRKKAESPHRDEWYKVDDILFNGLGKLFKKGIDEGSLRANLDPIKAAYSYGFLTSSVIQRLLDSGETFTNHFDLDLEEFADYSIELMLASIKS